MAAGCGIESPAPQMFMKVNSKLRNYLFELKATLNEEPATQKKYFSFIKVSIAKLFPPQRSFVGKKKTRAASSNEFCLNVQERSLLEE